MRSQPFYCCLVLAVALVSGCANPSVEESPNRASGKSDSLPASIKTFHLLSEEGTTESFYYLDEQARAWDAQTLSDEQNLIQPYYEALSQESRDMLTANLKFKYGDQWSGDLMNPNDRWQFGMRLMGYEDARGDCMPEPTNKQD